MGAYTYISEQDRMTWRNPKQLPPELQEVFEEALLRDPLLMINEYVIRVKDGWFGSKLEVRYSLYKECPSFDGSAYQAQYVICASKNLDTLFAYLCGIVNSPKTNKQ